MTLRARMAKLLVGSTAEAVALFRAAGTLVGDDRVRGPDDVAARLIAWGFKVSALIKVPVVRRVMPRLVERVVPGGVGFELARTGYMDAVVREEVGSGATQVVVLGAGFDSRAYRLPLGDAVVFEVDQPSMSSWKQARVRAVLGTAAADAVRFVAVDLETADLAAALGRAGYDPAARSVVVWSGVMPYLEPAAVDTTLRWMASQAAGSCLVFDYCWQEVVDGTSDDPHAIRVRRAAALRGEPWYSGIPRGAVGAFLAERGLTMVEEVDTAAARDRFLRRRDGSVVGAVWDFGGFVRARV